MTLTPAAGTYVATFTSSMGSSDGSTVFVSIYVAGVKKAASETRNLINLTGFGVGGNMESPCACIAIITVDGTQVIDIRWRTTTGTATMHQRELILLKAA